MRTVMVAALVCSLALAGCASTPTDDEVHDDNSPTHYAIMVPQWQVGNWWTYSFQDGGETTWVVTGDEGTDWIVDIDDADAAFNHAAFDEISTVGLVSKDHLAGSQEDGRVEFFQFPLTDGKTWQTLWDHQTYDATVTDITDSTAVIEYRLGDQLHRIIDFDLDAKWMKKIRAVDENGTELFAATLMRSGENYAGTFVRYDIHDLLLDFTGGFGNTGQSTFTVPDEATDVWYSIYAFCNPDGFEGDSGTYGYQVNGPDPAAESFYSEAWACPDGTGDEGETGTWADPPAGEWTAQGFYVGGSVHAVIVPRTEHVLTLAEAST